MKVREVLVLRDGTRIVPPPCDVDNIEGDLMGRMSKVRVGGFATISEDDPETVVWYHPDVIHSLRMEIVKKKEVKKREKQAETEAQTEAQTDETGVLT